MDDLNEGWVPATYLEPIYGQNEANKVRRETERERERGMKEWREKLETIE